MGRFNARKENQNRTLNLAGGAAYEQSPETALVSLLLTSFAQDQFYRKADQSFRELGKLMSCVSPEFAAKAGVYARNAFGMRSISHVLAAELAAGASGQAWAKAFYDRIVKRPDDMLEIAAIYRSMGGKNLPNAMKKGFAMAFNRFDAYQLAKYRGEGHTFKLVDLLNLVHPTASARNAQALKDLSRGTLKNTETWESQLTAAGQEARSEVQKAQLKAEAWYALLKEDKLGYLAMLRNMRNIAEQSPAALKLLVQKLQNKEQLKQALIMPFQILVAIDAVKQAKLKQEGALLEALELALELSVSNVPRFEGKTLVVIDDSGSMTIGAKGKGIGSRSCISLGAVFAAALVKSNDADLMRFSYDASYIPVSGKEALSQLSDRILRNANGGGTNFHAIFQRANKAYDRIIILSDMQGWMEFGTPDGAFAKYKKRVDADPYLYSFDLAGHSTLQFPEQDVFCIAGFSDKVFDIMAMLEMDPKALVNTIHAVKWSDN